MNENSGPLSPGGDGAGVTSPIERALLIAFPWLAGGLLLAPLGLLFGPVGPQPTQRMLIHLSLLVLLGLAIADRLVELLQLPWFPATPWNSTTRRLAGAVVLVIVPTGVVGLVTLASAAALRFDPSVQFLQLLSALDIAWVVAAALYGLALLEDRFLARGGALLLGALCVGSLWNYLWVVGFTEDGRWLVDGAQLLRLVIPVDVVAALVTTVLLVAGVRRSVSDEPDQPMEQASDQS